jgi:hypothetical protein
MGGSVMAASAARPVPAAVSRALLRAVRTVRAAPDDIAGAACASDADRDGALARMSGWLYGSWYCALDGADTPAPAGFGRTALSSALRASAAASNRWEADWVAVRGEVNGMCVAGRGTTTRELPAGDYANLTRPGLPVAPGDRIAVRSLVEWTDPATGFWCARCGDPRTPSVRLYFSVSWPQAGYAIAAVTHALDGAKVPYSFKCPSIAAAFSRVDSLVFYLDPDAWSAAAPVMAAMAKRARPFLRGVTPPLTERLAHGVAFAEDPGDNRSFGETRCAALAPGALRLASADPQSNEQGVAILIESLEAAGIDPLHPWLKGAGHA